MTKGEFVKKIEEALDFVSFKVGNRGYTILNWPEETVIGEWNKPETEKSYSSIAQMMDNYIIDGGVLSEQLGKIRITQMS